MAVGTYLNTALSISVFLAAIGGSAASQPTQATNPNPADGAIDVLVDANLSWERGESVLEEEVYFGTDPCALPKVADIIVLPTNPPLYNPGNPNLVASTTYYWQIVEVNGPDRYESPVWEFTTVRGEAQPEYPIDGALIQGDIVSGNVSTNLEFIPGATAVEHTGFFSDNYSKVESRAQDANLGPPPYGYIKGYEYTFWVGNPGVPPITDSLVRGTTYYWTVDETDALGNTFVSDIWEFTIQDFKATLPNPPNEATFVETDVLLSWQPGYYVEDHDIYMGTSWEDVNNARYNPFNQPPEFVATVLEPNIAVTSLALNTTYYWRVDQVNGRRPPFWESTYYKGPVWCFTTEPEGVGTIRMDLWWNVVGPPPIIPPPDPDPGPDETRFLTSFNSGEHLGDYYGGMIHGWLHPSKSGDYTFWLCSDDDGELFLSTDESPVNMVRIAWIDGWAGVYDWYNEHGTNNPNQQSAPIALVAGRKYYIRATWKDAGGGDHCMVAWQGPDQPLAPVGGEPDAVIPGNRLSPFEQERAYDPEPFDGQTGIELTVTLRWSAGEYAAEHDVYIGTDKALVESRYSGTYMGRVEFNRYGPIELKADQIYYWAIDEVNELGPAPYVWPGDVWCFTTEVNRVFVDIDATGANDGTSWEDAYNFLQDALADANSTPKPVEISVAEGIYTPDSNSVNPNGSGDRMATFQLINGVTLKGGFAGFGEANPDARDIELYETILSGDLDGNDVDVSDPCDLPVEPTRGENSYHVVTGGSTDANTMLEGFTITGGNSNIQQHQRGGGIYNESGSPTLANCIFTWNSAITGGGMSNRSGSPRLTNCTFAANWAIIGGGISNGSGSRPKLTKCKFVGNNSSWQGGGIYNADSISVMSCTFIGNTAQCGGGMYNEYYIPSSVLINCVFVGNSVNAWGGGIFNGLSDLTLMNCTLVGNSAEGEGGGLYIPPIPSPSVSFSSTAYYGYNLITNCIFRDNLPEQIVKHAGDISVVYSDIQGSWYGVGNIDADPCFVDANGGNLRLSSDSPCIDIGYNNAPNLPPTDLDGHPRIIDGDCNDTEVVDMGAYEFNYAYMGDFDYNCSINFADFSILGLAWTSQPGDFNWDFACNISVPADNIIDRLDLAAFIDNWLAGIQ